jgi:MerR HTH family regulatory protein
MGNQEDDDLEVGECLVRAVDSDVLSDPYSDHYVAQAAIYHGPEVIKAVGISWDTLQHWLARDVHKDLKLTQQNPGRGKSRDYTAYEVARLRFAKKLLDLNLPLLPAFKITGAVKKLWESVPGGMEANPFTNWLFIVRAEECPALKPPHGRFPIAATSVRAGDFSAIWAIENKPVGEALKFFGGSAVVAVNMTALLTETYSILAKLLSELRGVPHKSK